MYAIYTYDLTLPCAAVILDMHTFVLSALFDR